MLVLRRVFGVFSAVKRFFPLLKTSVISARAVRDGILLVLTPTKPFVGFRLSNLERATLGLHFLSSL